MLQVKPELLSDSESDRISKQHFFEQTEAQWRSSHASEPVDYALLNRLHSDSIGPESSSSPEKSPHRTSNRQQGNIVCCVLIPRFPACQTSRGSSTSMVDMTRCYRLTDHCSPYQRKEKDDRSCLAAR